MIHFLFKFPSDFKNLPFVRALIQKLCEDIEWLTDETYKITMAVNEICANAIKYGNKNDRRKYVEMSVKANDQELVVSIRDKGDMFNIKKYCSPRDKNYVRNHLAKGKEMTLGLSVVNRLMDKIELIPLRRGKEVRIFKFRNGKV